MKLVVDSNIFVSALDPRDSFHGECYPILKKILAFEIEAICPLLVLVEVTCVIRRRTNSEELAIAVYKNLSRLPAIDWLDITFEVAEGASILGAKVGLRGGDAIILQVALQYGIPLLTKDREIKQRAPGGILVLEPLEIY
jgi:predicted nucleic acid-binding protein